MIFFANFVFSFTFLHFLVLKKINKLKIKLKTYNKFIFLFLMLFLMFSSSIIAQDTIKNIKKDTLKKDTLKKDTLKQNLVIKPKITHLTKKQRFNKNFKYKIVLDGTLMTGNVERKLGVFRAEMAHIDSVFEFAMSPRVAYGEQDGKLAEREYYTDLTAILFPKNKVYMLSFGILEQSNLRAIQFRSQIGGGIGFHIFQKPNNALSVTNVIIHEKTDFQDDTKKQTIELARNSTRLKGKHTLIPKKLVFSHVTFMQPSITDIKNLRWNTLLTLEVPITSIIRFRITYERFYESVVVNNRKNSDTRLVVGFALANF